MAAEKIDVEKSDSVSVCAHRDVMVRTSYASRMRYWSKAYLPKWRTNRLIDAERKFALADRMDAKAAKAIAPPDAKLSNESESKTIVDPTVPTSATHSPSLSFDNKDSKYVAYGQEFEMTPLSDDVKAPRKPNKMGAKAPEKKTVVSTLSGGLDLQRILWKPLSMSSSPTQPDKAVVVKPKPRILFPVNESTTPLQFLLKLLPLSIFEVSAQQTNLYASQSGAANDSKWTDTSPEEQRAFFAVRIYMRLVPLPRLELYWSEEFGLPFVRKTFPFHRFQQLTKYWHFSDNTHADAETDPYHKVKPLLLAVKSASRSVYSPGPNLTVDEGMFGYDGRHPLTCFMPAKPHPWGYKVWMLADPSTFFLCDFNLYAPVKGVKQEGLTQTVVLDLLRGYEHTGRSVHTDNWYSSIPLFVKLYRQGFEATGTVLSTRAGMPAMIRKKKKKQAKIETETKYTIESKSGGQAAAKATECKAGKPNERKSGGQAAAKPTECKSGGQKAAKPNERKSVEQKAGKPNERKSLEHKAAKPTERKAAKPTERKAGGRKASKPNKCKSGKQKAAKANECKTAGQKSKKVKEPKRELGDTKIVCSGVITCTSWQDSKTVNFLSTIPNATLASTVLRRQEDGTRAIVPCPNVVKVYNANMLGVDKHNQLREQYQASTRSKKWWVSLADNLISTATTNAYILYHNFGSNQLAHFDFLVNVAHKLAGDFSAWKQ
jgi:hypothetical protein